jgi:hypothetical protein
MELKFTKELLEVERKHIELVAEAQSTRIEHERTLESFKHEQFILQNRSMEAEKRALSERKTTEKRILTMKEDTKQALSQLSLQIKQENQQQLSVEKEFFEKRLQTLKNQSNELEAKMKQKDEEIANIRCQAAQVQTKIQEVHHHQQPDNTAEHLFGFLGKVVTGIFSIL